MKRQSKSGSNSALKWGVSLILAIVVFFLLVTIEGNMLSNHEQTKVVVATQVVPKGTLITKENLSSYFTVEDRTASMVADSAVTGEESLENLVNTITDIEMSKGEMLSKHNVQEVTSVLKDVKDAVEVGLTVSDISKAVGGTLRQGDIVDIDSIDANNGTNVEVLKDVYVSKVFNDAGEEISATDKATAARTINVIIDKSWMSKYNELVNSNEVIISRPSDLK